MAAAFAVLFLLLQGVSLAHAAEHGSEHSHDGVVCEAVIHSEDETAVDPVLPPAGLPEVTPAAPREAAPYRAPASASAPARAPPARGPPLHSC